ncbi:hypothetical protein DACRYDRAFT_104808 [Dacryopinax primogenitus]|uniref:Protein FRA10AC1 n=1 Tax=Dacryopinax primogenitus (strain DJM 731) TaxID=1858805 RepID=M5G9I3_DACPD|nr:uncharacterized protein DACRYDRAFT_104808 [Dacryopinax primogenitus]EJU04915.1 hypothetical protein DACRYDRAFT_104808 [Dacryopinax primogenitus]
MSTQSEHSKSIFRNTLRGEDAYSRHQRYVHDYIDYYGGRKQVQEKKTDFDVLKAAHRFIRDEGDDLSKLSYADQLAVKYYSQLFKEFVICDLKHYKSGAIALRWRTDTEVVDGIGQFTCANPRCAHHSPTQGHKTPKLTAYELPFSYVEEDKEKNALVKAVLCERCARKLVWKRERDREKREEGEKLMPTVVDDDVPHEPPKRIREHTEDEEEEEYGPTRPPQLDSDHRRSRSPRRESDERERYARRRRSPNTPV